MAEVRGSGLGGFGMGMSGSGLPDGCVEGGGAGVDGVYLHFHKANEFLGMNALPTFICTDVIKTPDVSRHKDEYRAHLQKVFG